MAESSRRRLSSRQMEVLELLNKGKGRVKIAEELAINPTSVKSLIERIKDNLGLGRQTTTDKLIQFAREKGIVKAPR